MNAPKLIVGTIFAAIIGFLIVVPLYDILQGVLEFNPFMLLGVGLIAAVIFIKIYTGLGNRISIPMIVGAGIFFIALGLLTGGAAAVMAVAMSCPCLVGVTRRRSR